MKSYQFYGLMGAVLMTPHCSTDFGMSMAIVCLVIGLIYAVVEK
ncbi:hypothetical protein [Caballeronia sp. AZ7_KS35]|nr:hypothetical protein [Caballeronia sp. AZ7_KS35]